MCNIRLDARSRFPSGMEDYLEFHGWHFSQKMCEWAISRMRDRSGRQILGVNRQSVNEMLGRYGIGLENDKGYDSVYVAAMAKADYLGSSLPDESKMAVFIKDYIDDKDTYEGKTFTRFYADCIGSGTPIPWEDMV